MTLPFEQDEWVTLIKLSGEGFTDYYINVYGKDNLNGGSKVLIHTSKKYTLGNSNEFDIEYKLTVDYLFYNETAKRIAKNSSLPTQIEFILELVVTVENEDGETATEQEEVEESLIVHFVRYIPRLMNILGFSNGERLQRMWFNNGNNVDMDSVAPKLEAVSWSWLMSESSTVKGDYKNFKSRTWSHLNDNMFITGNKIRDSLKNEINKMLNDGLVKLPTKDNPKSAFGVIDTKIVTNKGEKIPEFEKHYFNSEPFDAGIGSFDLTLHFFKEGLDDFVAAIGSFKFHVLAIGELEYKESLFSNSININIQQLGFYAKDNYDFKQEKESLGFWKIINKTTIEVEREPSNKNGFYAVENKLYRDYRDAHTEYEEGYNYHLYSDIHYEDVDLNVTLKSV